VRPLNVRLVDLHAAEREACVVLVGCKESCYVTLPMLEIDRERKVSLTLVAEHRLKRCGPAQVIEKTR